MLRLSNTELWQLQDRLDHVTLSRDQWVVVRNKPQRPWSCLVFTIQLLWGSNSDYMGRLQMSFFTMRSKISYCNVRPFDLLRPTTPDLVVQHCDGSSACRFFYILYIFIFMCNLPEKCMGLRKIYRPQSVKSAKKWCTWPSFRRHIGNGPCSAHACTRNLTRWG